MGRDIHPSQHSFFFRGPLPHDRPAREAGLLSLPSCSTHRHFAVLVTPFGHSRQLAAAGRSAARLFRRFRYHNDLKSATIEEKAGGPWTRPVRRSPDWLAHVNAPQTEADVAALERSIQRGVPFGNPEWIDQTIARLGLESTLRPRGRPRKS